MKSLTWKLVVPVTVISFCFFTKGWYVLPVDAPDSIMTGFPFPYTCTGWHTSMSLQFFVLELIADVAFYFMVWFVLVYCINRFLIQIKLHNSLTVILISVTAILFSVFVFMASMPENVFKIKRDFDFEILETDYVFIWEEISRPDHFDFDAYHRDKKNR